MRTERRRSKKRTAVSPISLVFFVLVAAAAFFLLRARAGMTVKRTDPSPSPSVTAEPLPTSPAPPQETLSSAVCRAVFAAGGEETVLTAEAGTALELPAFTPTPGYTFFGWTDESGALVPDGTVRLNRDMHFESLVRVTLGGEAHSAYLPLDSSGQARPDELMSRGDAAIMFAGLVSAEAAQDGADSVFSDLTEQDACFAACSALRALGLLDGTSFRPAQPLTRADLFLLLARFYPEAEKSYAFLDLSPEEDAYGAFCLAAERGWLDYEADMAAEPDAELTRLQVVQVMNRVLGRSADPSILNEDLSAISDLPEEETSRLALLEAMIPHSCRISEDGETWTDIELPAIQVIPGFTSGDAEVDAWLKEILDSTIREEMSFTEQLRALYRYVLNSFRYRKGSIYEGPDPAILLSETRKMMEEQGGNCYTHSALLCELYRALGLEAKVCAGTISASDNPHAWVEATIDGTVYVFDPEMEKTILRFKKPYFDFFMRSYYDVKGWDYQQSFVID